jgi:hypothetical protein
MRFGFKIHFTTSHLYTVGTTLFRFARYGVRTTTMCNSVVCLNTCTVHTYTVTPHVRVAFCGAVVM